MLNHLALIEALRTRLLSTVVATTGSTTLTATETGFSRATGSFITDGFTPGMEVVPAGFTNNSVTIARAVTALLLTTDARAAQAEGSGRSLSVGIPVLRSWENTEIGRLAQRWYIREDYIPGPAVRATGGVFGEFEHYPMYILHLEGLANVGIQALYTVADAILRNFPPTLAFSLSDGDIVYVSSDAAPYRGQAQNSYPGTVETTITIPLVGRTHNTI